MPAWGDAGIIVPWRVYQNYADTRLLEEHFESARRWVDFIRRNNPDLIWAKGRNNDYNDWLNGDSVKQAGWPAKGGAVPNEVFATAFFAHSTELVAKMAEVLGRKEDGAALRRAVSARSKPPSTSVSSTPTAASKATRRPATPWRCTSTCCRTISARKPPQHLVENIRRYQDHLSTGIQTTHRVMLELTRNGRTDVGWQLLTNRTFPSWGYMIDNGATTIWERWDGYVKGRGFQDAGMNSFNHWAFGAVGEWMWRDVGRHQSRRRAARLEALHRRAQTRRRRDLGQGRIPIHSRTHGLRVDNRWDPAHPWRHGAAQHNGDRLRSNPRCGEDHRKWQTRPGGQNHHRLRLVRGWLRPLRICVPVRPMRLLPVGLGLALLWPAGGPGQTLPSGDSSRRAAEVTATNPVAEDSEIGRQLQNSFVWLASAPAGRQAFVAFRKQIALDALPAAATLHLFADSRYLLWVNGRYVERGPCRFDPVAPEYDTLDLRPCLRRGTNALVVLVHHYHDGKASTNYGTISGRIMRHAPGLTALLELRHPDGRVTRLPTDSTWRGTTRTRFLPSPTDRWEDTWASIPDRIDARRDPGDWTQPQFDDSGWEKAAPVNGKLWGALRLRGIPRLRESEVGPIILLDHARAESRDRAARWIWTSEPDYPAQRSPRWSAPEGERFFRRRLDLPEGASNVVLWATADNELDCHFNGRKVGENHGDISSWMTLQRMVVSDLAKPGPNVIAIRAINKHYGVASDPAGLLVVVTWQAGAERGRLISDGLWKANARAVNGWQQTDYDDRGWSAVLVLCPYPEGPWRDNLRNYPRAGAGDERARPLTAALPLALQAGDQLVMDAGEFVQAYSVLDCEAEAGSELELEYAPRYFETGRKPAGSYGRVNRYIARAGRQSYMSGDTFGFKYLVVRLKSGQATLHGVRLVNRLYPFDVLGSFHCNEPLLNQVWSNCVQTIRVCSEDAYVDCATRERTEWLADGYAVAYRTTRVAFAGPSPGGPPRYGDPRLLRSMLRHIGQSLQPDGRLKAHHPSDRWDIHGYIEDYSCLWVRALREYHDHTGDLEPARELWPALTAQLQWFLDRRTTSGLVQAREFVYFGNPLLYQVCEGATLNAFVCAALRDAALLAEPLGRSNQATLYRQAADALQRALNSRLWDNARGTYFGSLTQGKPTPPAAHAALCCLHFGLVPPEREPLVRRWLLDNYRKESFGYPYTYQYLLEEIFRADTAATDREALDLIRERWKGMAECETRTVWEGIGPSENAHEAGAVPAYFLSAWVLGVRLDGLAAARRLLIQPRLAGLQQAKGTVVTELGPVPVRWRRDSSQAPLDFEVEVPSQTRATLSLPLAGEKPVLVLDDRTLTGPQLQIKSHRAVVEIGPGLHRGRLATAGSQP